MRGFFFLLCYNKVVVLCNIISKDLLNSTTKAILYSEKLINEVKQ